MKNKLGSRHGFTIVELLVTLSLTAMVIVTLGSFFLNHLRSYHRAVDDVLVQNQLKSAMNLFVEKAMVTTGITYLSSSGDSPYYVVFGESSGPPLIFSYTPLSQQLKWGMGNAAADATNTVAGMITQFKLEPTTNDGTPVSVDDLSQASMAEVTITVSGTDNGVPGPPEVVTLDNSLRFRNYTVLGP
ncbi:MAG: prepilin-type N-terminal cleavage/methylation domain-containing protein [Desulfosporosinus sp.]|nr:prepilin-type N-terminal cleavage/methylation domain-containing protein [Desulfosporosinus sp.]